jgi:hypothetical protein
MVLILYQLEHIYGGIKFLATCLYGIIFIVLGNLSGNSVGFGSYLLKAANLPDNDAAVRGLAVGALTTACLLHAVWRKGGIWLNNVRLYQRDTKL